VNLFVTGGAGFIGTNFVRMAVEKGHNVLNYDALTYAGDRENLVELEGGMNYHFVHGDICDTLFVEKELAKGFDGKPYDMVVNIAAESHVDRSLYFATEFSRTNCLGVATLLEAARKNNVPTFIQVSTDEVYGSLGATGMFTLASPLRPSSPYSASKTAGDLVALSMYHSFGYDVRVTRCTNNYGPYQHPEKFIPTIITKALHKITIPIYGDGLAVRDWIFVEDHCNAIFSVIEKGKAGQTYLFGGSSELTNLDLTTQVLASLAEKTNTSPEEYYKLLEHVTDRPGHDRRYAIDWSVSEKELRWKPETKFADGIERTVAWYLKEEQWWANHRKKTA